MRHDPFPEYETPPTHNSADRLSACQTANNLQTRMLHIGWKEDAA